MTGEVLNAETTTAAHSHSVIDSDPLCWSRIYDAAINLAVWTRTPSAEVMAFSAALMRDAPTLSCSLPMSADTALDVAFPMAVRQLPNYCAWRADVNEWVDAFRCLFDAERVGLRVRVLDAAMCPRFHVDHIPVRMITTYGEHGMEWLPNDAVDRRQLGVREKTLSDAEAGLYANAADIRRVPPYAGALAKGELWQGNAGCGVVHRSPALHNGQQRVLLTLDLID